MLGQKGLVHTDQVGEETKAAECMDGRLSRLGFLLAVHVGDERHVDEREVFVSDTELELAHSFDERRRLDVSNGTSELFIE